MESNAPPRPGIIFPESFSPADLLNTDSTKSPKIAAMETNKPKSTIFHKEPEKTSGQIKEHKIPLATDPKIPPMKPIRLLLGLALTSPRVPLPKSTPKNQAAESHKKTSIKNVIMNSLEWGKIVILERKDKRCCGDIKKYLRKYDCSCGNARKPLREAIKGFII